MEDLSELRRDPDIPKLNKDNFLEWRECILDRALRFSSAGTILQNGIDPGDPREPTFDQRVMIPDPNNPGQLIEGDRKYANTQFGHSIFVAEHARWQKEREKKFALISLLLTTMERDVRGKLDNVPGFREHCAQANVIAVWNTIQDNSPELLKQDNEGKSVSKSEYLSLIMSLMFVGRFTRPDILLPVTILATFSADPQEKHMIEARRVLRYLAANPERGIVFDGKIPIKPEVYADASHAIHPSGHGQGGILMTLGSGPIFCKSFKLKSITRSSTESELYALEEASTYAVWWRKLLQELEVPESSEPITVYQDN